MIFKDRPIKILITIALVFVIFFALEVYLRCTATYITKRKIESSFYNTEIDARILVIDMPNKPPLLIPNTHIMVHNHHVSGRNIPVKINSFGFRDQEISNDKKDNELRILVLGDSITFGDYLQANEVYVERIEQYLNQNIKAGKVNVINAGYGGIGIKEEVDILIERGLKLNPDIIILAFYLNDSHPPWSFHGESHRPGWLRRNSVLAQAIYQNIKIFQWINTKGKYRFDWLHKVDKLDWQNDREAFLELASMAEYDWGAGWKDSSWSLVDQQLDILESLSKQHNFKVVVVVFPIRFQVYAKFIEDAPQQRMREKAASRGFYYYNLLPMLRKQRDKDLFFDLCHPTKEANDIIGKKIANFMQNEIVQYLDLVI